VILGIDFPPISHLIEWPDFLFKGTAFGINKVVLEIIISSLAIIVFYIYAGRKKALVPTGSQNFAESIVDFVQNDIIAQTIGEDGMWWTPFLLTIFSFVFMLNIWEVVPGFQMPANARIAVPAMLAIVVWVVFNAVGLKNQGPIGYFKSMLFPPGVPKVLYILITPIEFVSTIFVRPLSLAVRLFANMLAGHLLLGTFAVLTGALWASTKIGFVLPFALLTALTGFEILVAVLQAFIFTILTAVYIGGARHAEH
jgi:F-type H+-transporting ATPase subunit a